ncbi:dihydrolipoamide acetyltransferase family protein [Nocardioides panzhihuensis]|uniref:Dihydrolipoamide acetyltransferase component of pyruvate dehydrogenase complex n=1 Tax=Nocardioides panzhihuensis TaxID=860243 RepID=A0A7Z0IUC9_9ACTN|nr:dihydrolipoamide acetyltransferase family protein [Nocardioides panzhihuensis]NYI79807.1 pyruvate dehydrogenase E2 component (dihydrolipoamide acetyltransferase) [Nocardioides panzhihuensis]
MVNEFKLPDVGEGLTEAEIVEWHVAVGDVIKVNDPVCDIETAKSVVELPSPYAGVVQALLVEVGTEVQVGTPIIRIGDSAEESVPDPETSVSDPEESVPDPEESVPDAETSVPEQEEPEKPLTLVGYGSKEDAVVRRNRTAAAPAAAAGNGVLAKPPARKLARDLGVDLATVTPEREDGVITTADVEALKGAPPAETREPVEPAAPVGGERREPIKGLRKQMGQAMVDSAFTLPHVTIWTTIDVTRTSELVGELKTDRDFAEVRVSPLLIVAKAALLAMRRTPIINSWWDEAAQEIVFKEYVNLGIAAATPRGLQVPNVKGADRMSLVELGAAINELTATARTGKTPPADQAGGTFTITNIGPFGIDGGAPIINPGESAILSVGAFKRQPWIVGTGDDERIEPRDVCTLALSFDHRHIDGEAGSRYLADVAKIVGDPSTALLF